jgi:hypothetical protein
LYLHPHYIIAQASSIHHANVIHHEPFGPQNRIFMLSTKMIFGKSAKAMKWWQTNLVMDELASTNFLRDANAALNAELNIIDLLSPAIGCSSITASSVIQSSRILLDHQVGEKKKKSISHNRHKCADARRNRLVSKVV